MDNQLLQIQNRTCRIYGTASAEYLLLQMVDEHDLAGMEREVEAIHRQTTQPFLLAAVQAENWNDDLSPWPAPPVWGKQGFGGRAEAPGAALRQSGGEVHARPERAPQNAVEGRNTPARPAPIQKPAAKPVQNEQSSVSPVQPVVQQMVAEEKENMDTLPAGKVEENAPNMELPVPSREVTLDSSPKQDDVSEQPTASVFQSDEPEELPVAPVVQQEAPDQPMAPSYTESTPVEDILKVMTFEEAQNVVVDSGLSKGKTMATVAKERPVSLKFYLTPGNKSTNNIVRAAAQIMLDGMAAQKAG